MKVGTLCIRLMIRDAASLKDKRRVIKSLKDRIRNKFNAAVAEVAEQDLWQKVVLGVVTVGNDGQFINSVLSQIINFILAITSIEIIDYSLEEWSV